MFGWLLSFLEDIFTSVFAINMEFNQSEYYMEDNKSILLHTVSNETVWSSLKSNQKRFKISSQVPVIEMTYFEFQAFTGSEQEPTQAHVLSTSCSRQNHVVRAENSGYKF